MFDSFEQNPELPNPAPETPGPEMAESVEKSVPEDSALRLQDFVSKGLGHLEHNFIFRKLGITYDYASPPRDFPRSTLPNVKEVREGMPNAAGIGTGMTNCTANTSLLLDGYLTRLELGIARPEEDRIMDRLVAGLIRIGTAGPRNQFVRGLTPDGRGFYPATSMVDHIHYAHALYRACHSPTIRIESQTKIRDICAKWLERIVKSDFTITGLTPEESRLSPRLPGEDHVEKADEREWERLVTLLHLAAVTYN
ncbi:MAG: hypothetical protein JXA52_05840, partial [Planctomycetes bacterium]|nr:hypothetical protein [Planctomycetota bacterium]